MYNEINKSLTRCPLKAMIFVNADLDKSVPLTKAALKLANKIEGFEVVGICKTAAYAQTDVSGFRGMSNALITRTAKKVFNFATPISFRGCLSGSLSSLACRYRVGHIVPPNRNINHADFAEFVRNEVAANIAFCFGCTQIFRRELIDAFDVCVNLHSGILPKYRGWMATQWSVYFREADTGYCFHHMSEEVDQGPIICSGTIPVENRSPKCLEYDKAVVAGKQLLRVLQAVADGNPGKPQQGISRKFDKKDVAAIQLIENPATLDFQEIQHRIRSFDGIWLAVNGDMHYVTKVKRLKLGVKASHSFVTKDRVTVLATRFNYLPFAVYRLLNRIGVEHLPVMQLSD
ncbi:MAG: formyltransferase family protein [Pirellulaceae bacterium]|nr:formyltransferase family protein [Pirellulaceae bacterium]